MKDPILVTGLPRSGTTLVVKLLNEIPNVVALNEPMPVSEMVGLNEAELFQWIDQYTERVRSLLIAEGKAETKHINGLFVDNTFRESLNELGLRPTHATHGLVDINRALSNQFTLAIKHNGSFTAVAHYLVQRYRCFAITRNPLALLLSWQTVDIPINYGRMPVAEAIDPDLHASLNKIKDSLDRQIYILNWFFDRFHKYFPKENILSYESLTSIGGSYLEMITPGAFSISSPLRSKNANQLYKKEFSSVVSKRLLDAGGAFTQFYDFSEIELLREELNNL
jgi:hypothetical protein